MTIAVVTGSAGFIGSNLVRALLEQGHVVRGVDDFSTGRQGNLEGIRDTDDFTLYERDIARDDLDDVLDGAETVFHQAAIPSVPRSIENPRATTRANCLGTTALLEAAVDAGVETVVVASSSSVYGSSGDLPKREDQPVAPGSPYALSKYWTEQLAMQYADLYELQTIALRYFNVFGPRQDPRSDYAAVIPKFISLMLDNERPPIFGDGEQSRDFTFIDNVVHANIQAAESDVSGEVFNIACGDRITVNALVERLNGVLGTSLEPRYDDPRPGDVRHSHASIEKATQMIGYEPIDEFEAGLEQTMQYYRANS